MTTMTWYQNPKCWMAVLAGGIMLFGCGPQTPEQRAKSEQSAKEFDDEVRVSSLAQQGVKKCLAWPHDAAFNWFPSVSFNMDRSAAFVKGTVKAKNSFGAALTHEYEVILKRDGGEWIVDMIGVGNKIVYRRAPEPTITSVCAKRANVKPQNRADIDPVMRTWIDASGKYQIDAEFQGMAFGKVKLKKADGKIITVSLDELSENDQKWLGNR